MKKKIMDQIFMHLSLAPYLRKSYTVAPKKFELYLIRINAKKIGSHPPETLFTVKVFNEPTKICIPNFLGLSSTSF